MSRSRFWLFVLPLLVAGCESAHALLDRLAPASYKGAELFEASGGGSELIPLLAALGVGVILLAITAGLFARSRTRPICWWVVAALPVLAFAIQEHVEYAVGRHTLPLAVASHSMFFLGVALQLPFAAAAYVAARLLLRLTESLPRRGRALPFLPRVADTAPRPAVSRRTPSRARLAGDARLNRGPPLGACG
jgi:hypothetical protein